MFCLIRRLKPKSVAAAVVWEPERSGIQAPVLHSYDLSPPRKEEVS
jgi:hypothetical protein